MLNTGTDCGGGSDNGEDVCRDFMRNVCTRGRKCRFKHPIKLQNSFTGDPTVVQEERQKLVRMFCHDFQNTICSRDECKYIHCSKDDQDCFMNTGFLQSIVLEDAISKSIIPSLPDEVPVCKDYLSGECRRGKSCRYRHLSHSKYKKELNILYGVEHINDNVEKDSECKRFKSCYSFSTDMPCIPIQNSSIMQGYFPHEKCKLHMMGMFYNAESCVLKPTDTCLYNTQMCDRNRLNQQESPTDRTLQEENMFLRQHVEELKKQLADLSAANEFLLDQNAQLRLARKNNNVGGVTPVSVTVTGTPVLSQQTTGQLVTGIPAQTNTGQIVTASGQQLVTATVPVSIAPASLTASVNPNGQQIVGGVSGPGQQIISTGTLNTVTVAGPANTGQLVAAAVPVSCNATGQIMAAVSTVTVAGQTATTPQLVPVSCTATQQQLVATAVPVSCTSTGQLVATGTLTVAGQNTQTQQLVAAAVPVSCTSTGQLVATGTLTVAGQNTQTQQLVPVSTQQLVPVSLATAVPVPVSISAVSLAPTQPNGTNTIPIAINGRPTQPLVSYPIRTHSVL